MKIPLGWCLIAVFAVLLSGCATRANNPVASRSATTVEEPPAWAGKSNGQSPAEIWFVGHGMSNTEAEARRMAEASAESLYVRFLGADVLISDHSVTSTATDEFGINHDTSELRQHASLSSSAFISGVRFEYSTARLQYGYSVWTRMFIPNNEHRRITHEVDTRYERQVNRLAEARRKVEESRYSEEYDHVFALTTGSSIRRFDSLHPLRSELAAVDAARMDALVRLSEHLSGTKIDNVRLADGGFSRAYSGGHVFHDELSTRVWTIGNEVKATVTMLGWISR